MTYEWLKLCNSWKNKWEDEGLNFKTTSRILSNKYSIYEVIDILNTNAPNNTNYMFDAGSPSYVCPVNLKIRGIQSIISSPSQADMGWGIPASVGVGLAAKGAPVVLIIGDGSFMTNVQELSAIRYHQLPVKIILLNNDGYLSIKNTQKNFYSNRVHGVSNNTGIHFPNYKKLAESFDIRYWKISKDRTPPNIGKILHDPDSCIMEFICIEDEEIIPSQNFKNVDGKKIQCGLDDMYPFLTDYEKVEMNV
jgi:acetolactate synthase-1/2/3 large subunit